MALSMRSISSSLMARASALPAGEQSRDRLGEFLAHLLGAGADVFHARAELAATDRRQARQQEAVAHAADDRIVRVDHAGGREQQPDLALPGERAAAIAAEMPGPGAVVDFAQRGQHLGPVSVCIDRIEPKSFSTMMPKSPICRSSPPCAPLSCCFLRRARQQPGDGHASPPAPPWEAAPSR